jgi:hypothetical protein
MITAYVSLVVCAVTLLMAGCWIPALICAGAATWMVGVCVVEHHRRPRRRSADRRRWA